MKNIFKSRLKILVAFFCAVLICVCLAACSIHIGAGKYRYDNANLYTAGGATLPAENIRSVEVDWITGPIYVSPSSSGEITFTETSDETDENYLLYYAVIDGALKIKFQKSGALNKPNLSKKLVIGLPQDVVFTEIELDSVTGDISVNGGRANALKVDSVTGNVSVSPAVSGLIEINVVTGNVFIEAEEGQGYRVRFDSVTGSVFNPVHAEMTRVGDDTFYTYGDGAASIEVDIVTGKLCLYPPSADPAA